MGRGSRAWCGSRSAHYSHRPRRFVCSGGNCQLSFKRGDERCPGPGCRRRPGDRRYATALAFGTETVPWVDKITGPGNRYVAAAKKLVFGMVGIDSIAGPSEVVIVADDTARASYVASDLLAQAEHGEDAAAILLTTSEMLALEVVRELAIQTSKLSRLTVIEKSLARYGAIIVVDDMDEACAI